MNKISIGLCIILSIMWFIIIYLFFNGQLPYLTTKYTRPDSLESIIPNFYINEELEIQLEFLKELNDKSIPYILIESTLLGAVKYGTLLPNHKEIYIGMKQNDISTLQLSKGDNPGTYYYKKNDVFVNVYDFIEIFIKDYYDKSAFEDTKKIKFYNLEVNVPINRFAILKKQYDNWEDVYTLK